MSFLSIASTPVGGRGIQGIWNDDPVQNVPWAPAEVSLVLDIATGWLQVAVAVPAGAPLAMRWTDLSAVRGILGGTGGGISHLIPNVTGPR